MGTRMQARRVRRGAGVPGGVLREATAAAWGRGASHCSLLVLALVGARLCVAPLAGAHDFWIQPTTFEPEFQEQIGVGLFVGDHGAAREVRRTPERLRRFEAIETGGVLPVAGFAHQTPAGIYRARAVGPVTLVYEGGFEEIVLSPEKFEAYLMEEGLEDVLAERRGRGESGTPGRERYARSCKAILHVDGATASVATASIADLALEIVPERDPSFVRVPERLSFVLRFEDVPLAARLVELLDLDDPAVRYAARTDANGRVDFAAPGPGRWMVATVHMRRATPGRAVDWESYWSTLTFEIRDDDARNLGAGTLPPEPAHPHPPDESAS